MSSLPPPSPPFWKKGIRANILIMGAALMFCVAIYFGLASCQKDSMRGENHVAASVSQTPASSSAPPLKGEIMGMNEHGEKWEEKYPYLSKGFTRIFGPTPIGVPPSNKKELQQLEDSEKFQKFLHELQFPSDCDSKRIYDIDHHPYGLGSQIHVSAMSLLEAASVGMTSVLTWKTRYHAPSRCKSQLWECTFLEISSCTAADAGKKKESQTSECKEPNTVRTAETFLRHNCSYIKRKQKRIGAFSSGWLQHRPIIRNLKKRAKIEGEYGALFYFREAVRFLLRPNELMTNFTLSVKNQVKGLPSNQDMSQVFGAHIRHGEDKMARAQYSAQDFAKFIYHRLEAQGSFKYVFLASNSKSAHTDLPNHLRKLSKGRGADFEAPKVVYIPNAFFKTIGTGDSKQDPYSTLKNYDQEGGWDEMMSMVAQLFILSNCGAFVGTFHHNMGQLAYELMSASTYRFSVQCMDMSGSPWFSGWWASGYPHGPLHAKPMWGRRL